MNSKRVGQWFHDPLFEHPLHTAVAGVLSYLVARLSGLPEPYWAAISTIIVMQSAFHATLPLAVRRCVGTALGASMGALLGTFLPMSIWIFGVGVFVLGVLCFSLGKLHRTLEENLDKTTYRYAGITLAIIILIPSKHTAAYIAVHRFCEVSIGIVVALVLTDLWPESPRQK